MLTSLALLFLVGILFSQILERLRLPGLLGMILTGILLGPYGLNWLSDSLMNIAAELRQLALVLILLRAGLALDLNDLKRVGRPAILLCFVPAAVEILGYVLLGPRLLGLSAVECAVMGAVIAAVSPAVIVPRMLKLMEEKRGTDQSIPQMIMAGASADDVFVIVLFSSFLTLAQGGKMTAASLLPVPVSIITGVLTGALIGLALCWFFRSVHLRDSIKVLILMSAAFLLLEAETQLKAILPFSGLLAVSRFSPTAVAEVFTTVGRRGNDVVCAGRRGRQSCLSVQGRRAADAFDLDGAVLPDGGRGGLSDQNAANPEGTAFLYDRLLSESDRPGCNRRGSAESGLGLRRACLKRGGDGDSDHSAVGGAGDRSDLPAMAEKSRAVAR